jgi:ABC-type polar amino acid transport system ATPase subunit
MSKNNTIIEIKGLNHWYGNFHVLKEINLETRRSSCVVICGPSGSGKSTLLRCINGLEVFKEGDVIINGKSVSQCFHNHKELYKLRSKFGMVFQHFELYPHMRVLDNITLAPRRVLCLSKNEAEKSAMALLEKVGILEQAYKYPANLSGGQQQRVAIARALAMNPDILLFDEPTSALDPEMIRDVLKVMADLAKEGMTMLVVTHEMGFANAVADEIVFMEEGNIIEHDDAVTFFKCPKSNRAVEFVDRILVHI